MQRKNAFTFIELLLVLVILGIIMIIVVPFINNRLTKESEEVSELTKKMIYSATELYVKDYSNQYPLTEEQVYCISLQELVDHERLAEPLIDVKTGNTIPLDTKIAVSLKNGKEEYELNSESCKEKEVYTNLTFFTRQVPYEGDSIEVGEGILKNEGIYGIRFEGKNPNNYVEFNDELWRIIGVVDGKLKIISDKSIGKLAWDSTNVNNWTQSSLQKCLNGDYYHNTNTGTCPSAVTARINDVARTLIDTTSIWYLKGNNTNSTSRITMYDKERNTGGVASENPEKVPNESTGNTIYPIGLMYASDYGFAAQEKDTCSESNSLSPTCNNYNWLFNSTDQWLLTLHSSGNNLAFYIASGGMNYGHYVKDAYSIRPALNLASTVKIIDGTGELGNPYELSK